MARDKLSHRERILTICRGDQPDRYAASFWRHFYHLESTAEGTAEAMLNWQRLFDWDFMKINPRADYHIEDWGLKQSYSRDEFTKHVKTSYPIRKPEDWIKINPLPMTAPSLAEHLKVVTLIRKRSDRELPILMTVFTPLAIAGRMVQDNQMLADHMRAHPELIHSALRAIAQTFQAFVAELRNAGADGIFFATTQWASSDLITWQEYEAFGIPYDREVIEASEGDSLNLLHVCASNNFLEPMVQLNYPAQMINWDGSDPTNLPLDLAYEVITDQAMVGGVDYNGWLLKGNPDEVAYLTDQLKENNQPSRVIIGPGCSIAPETPLANLQAIRDRL